MEKVRPWCGQPSDRGRLKNRTEHIKKPDWTSRRLTRWGMGNEWGVNIPISSRLGSLGRVVAAPAWPRAELQSKIETILVDFVPKNRLWTLYEKPDGPVKYRIPDNDGHSFQRMWIKFGTWLP